MDFVVLSSSGGTTFQAVIDRLHDGTLTARCLGLVTDRVDRGCAARAWRAGLPVRVVERKEGETREEYDRRLDEAVCSLMIRNACHPELVEGRHAHPCVMVRRACLPDRQAHHDTLRAYREQTNYELVIACIGWMWLLSPEFVRKWRNRILNVHPSLLPKYPGRHPHEEVLAAHEKESGMTIHWVDEGTDTGPIIVQKKCSVFPGDTVETLKTRVQELEKEWYPKMLRMLQEKATEATEGTDVTDDALC